MTFVVLLKLSPRPLLRLCSCQVVAGGRPKSRRVNLIDTLYFKQHEPIWVIGGGLLSTRFLSVTIFCCYRACLRTTPTSRSEWPFARAANVHFLFQKSWENRVIEITNTAFTDSENVFVRAT